MDVVNRTEIRVRYADTDQMGIANNSMYLTWFEVGRVELLRARGLTYRGIEDAGYFLPVIEAGIKYLKPARYDDVLTVESRVAKCTRLRIRMEYRIFCDGKTIVTGFTEHVFTDRDLRPCRIPETVIGRILGTTK